MEQWRRLMEKQSSQGGLIDHSKDPHLVDWSWVSSHTCQHGDASITNACDDKKTVPN